MMEIEFTDRYGCGPGPDVDKMCLGDCEGTGMVPINRQYIDGPYFKAWYDAHKAGHTFRARIRDAWLLRDITVLWRRCDGWHFVKCYQCGGTGLRGVGREGA